jgi:nucleotide-binding universal stress UspA family protein
MNRFVLPLRWPWGPQPQPSAPDAFAGKLILLASEGRPIPRAAVDFAGRMAERAGAEVHVLSIARVWGTGFGMPHPGLMPSKRELQGQRDDVAAAVARLKRRDIAATGQIFSTRNAAKRILAEGRRRCVDAIVMATDPPRHWLVSNMVWSQEPLRVRRLATVPVYLVIEPQRTVTR